MRFEMRLGLRTTITLPAASGAIPAPPASTPEPRGSDERLAIIVPCHRIVTSDGGLGGFGKDANELVLKQTLLDLEAGNP